MLSIEDISTLLRSIREQDGHTDIISAGRISGITVKEHKVGFVLTLQPQEVHHSVALEAACERALRSTGQVSEVTIITTASSAPERSAPARKSEWDVSPIPHVKKVIAIASGKGGVGKSTTTVNLAHALTAAGKHVGILDADIYGPSLPRMMGIAEKPASKDGLILPLMAHSIACLSMGMMVEEEAAIVWRGPQASRALHQMLRGTQWGCETTPLDILLIDLPPGTGDIHLSLVQQAPLTGAVIVTTPQEVALADARKAINMFRKVYIPVLGIIENMSGFVDPSGAWHAIFGEGGGERLAQAAHVPLLGRIPLEIAIREAADSGQCFKDTRHHYQQIVQQLMEPLPT